jgi:hypothetical protein
MIHVNRDRRTPVPEAPEMVIGETMITVRKVGWPVMVALALMVPPGEVLHVKVSLDSRSTVVASTTIRSGARYRFSAVPGEYRVTGWWGSRSVAVRAGRAVTANFASDCV